MRDVLPSHPKFEAISHARKVEEEDSGSLTVHEKDNMPEVWVGRVFSECFPLKPSPGIKAWVERKQNFTGEILKHKALLQAAIKRTSCV